MSVSPAYEVVVVGGGPAGLTTAIYTTRLGHRTAVFEKRGGRHAAVSAVHNVYGVSEDVSGRELSKHAADQFVEYGGDYHLDTVRDVSRADDGDEFVVSADHATVSADRVVFATGFTDRGPTVPGIQQFAGRGLHYCLHCDAYQLGDGPVFVLGHDDHAAEVAMLMLNFTADVDLLLDDHDPEWSDETERQLQAHPVDRVETAVTGAFARGEARTESPVDDEPWLGGLEFGGGAEGGAVSETREYLGGFAMYGLSFNTDLAEPLGCALTDEGALDVDDDQQTSVDGVYAVGDITHGQNQMAVAAGDGARAGVAIHKDLRRYPRPLAALDGEDVDESEVPAASPELRARMRRVREFDAHAGLRGPKHDD